MDQGKAQRLSTTRGRTNRLRRLSSGRTRQMQQTGVIAGALRHAIRHIQRSLRGSRIAHLLTGNNLNRSEFRVSNIRAEHDTPPRTRETYIIDCLGVIVARFLSRTLMSATARAKFETAPKHAPTEPPPPSCGLPSNWMPNVFQVLLVNSSNRREAALGTD